MKTEVLNNYQEQVYVFFLISLLLITVLSYIGCCNKNKIVANSVISIYSHITKASFQHPVIHLEHICKNAVSESSSHTDFPRICYSQKQIIMRQLSASIFDITLFTIRSAQLLCLGKAAKPNQRELKRCCFSLIQKQRSNIKPLQNCLSYCLKSYGVKIFSCNDSQ